MVHQEENAALLALRGGLRGRFRRSFDCMENAFEVLQDRLDHTATPAERAELTPLLEELQTQLLCLRRLGDQASDAATRHCCMVPVSRGPSTCWVSCGKSAKFCGRKPRNTRCPSR